MKTLIEDYTTKLNAEFATDCLRVEVCERTTYFNINIPHDGYGGLTLFQKLEAKIISIDQWNGYTSILLVVDNELIDAL